MMNKVLYEKKKFRLRTKIFLLTYPQLPIIPSLEEQALQHFEKLFLSNRKDFSYVLSTESTTEKNLCLHVYLEFKTSQAIYSKKKLDIPLGEKSYRGNYLAVKTRKFAIQLITNMSSMVKTNILFEEKTALTEKAEPLAIKGKEVPKRENVVKEEARKDIVMMNKILYEKKRFRLRTKIFSLTYPQLPIISSLEEQALQHFEKLFLSNRKDFSYVLSTESTTEKNLCLHVYLEFKTSQAIYSKKKLDIPLGEKSYRGNYLAVKTRKFAIQLITNTSSMVKTNILFEEKTTLTEKAEPLAIKGKEAPKRGNVFEEEARRRDIDLRTKLTPAGQRLYDLIYNREE